MSNDPAASLPITPGDVIADKYRVERVLGRGGMGVVVAAMHLHLDQRVALKFIIPGAVGDDTQAIERFLREARAAVRLKSEHVAKVLDVAKLPSGSPYIVMEFLEGQDLSQVVELEGAIQAERAADYVLQACEAIAEAHAMGIVHRDVKPQNLFLTQGLGGVPLVKVLDFGISKVRSANGIDSALTRTASVMGSPMYMAPEQMRSARAADARSDIWALGVVLYTLLTGGPPFEAETMTELALKVVQDPHPPVSARRPGVAPGLSAIVDRCLAKDPANRFSDVSDLAFALSDFAPPASRLLAENTRTILRRNTDPPPRTASMPSFPDPTLLSPGGSLGATPPLGNKTMSGAWAQDAKSGRAKGIVGIAIVAILGLLAAILFGRLRHATDGDEARRAAIVASPLAPAAAAPSIAPPPPPSPPQLVPVVGSSTDAATTSAPFAPPRSDKAPKPASASPPSKAGRHDPAAPSASTHDDDIPALR
jgi:serine/threonine-protein kinase